MGSSSLFRWLLVLPAALIGFVLGQSSFALVKFLFSQNPALSSFLNAGWLISDCLASALFIILGTKVAPNYRFLTAVALSLVVATWHGVLIGANPFQPVSEQHSEIIVALTCLTGLAISIVVCWEAYLREREWQETELRNFVPEAEQVEETSERGYAVPRRERKSSEGSYDANKPAAFTSPKEQTYFAHDLILLERELLRIEPCTESYISALRLGIAIERDEGYTNLEGESFSFAQLMRDLAMRISVRHPEDGVWLEIAGIFWQYPQSTHSERSAALARILELLAGINPGRGNGAKVESGATKSEG
ncbi:MAG TPA: hypothetical protein V6D17_00720 [Candidatus Obscuribacterales bacterium]